MELLILRNPPVNALSTGVMSALDAAVREISDDSNVRSVVLAGDGTYFSAGADLKEMGSIAPTDAPRVVREGHETLGRISALPVPVIAAIQGLAVGGGLELALACDLRVAGEAAKLGAPEVQYGLMPAYGGTQRLARAIGPARAKELIFTGNTISAADALRLGLVNRVVPAGQELRAAGDLAHTIGTRAPRAVRAAKRAITEGLERTLTDGLALERSLFESEVLGSRDLVEGLTAFVERRPPRFTGT